MLLQPHTWQPLAELLQTHDRYCCKIGADATQQPPWFFQAGGRVLR
jgi:hypothetical protein